MDFACYNDFENLAKLLSKLPEQERSNLAKQTNAAFLFAISKKSNNTNHYWLLDLLKKHELINDKDASNLSKGGVKPSVTIECTDEVMRQLIHQEIDPTSAFMSGALSIKGNMMYALKLKGTLGELRKMLDSKATDAAPVETSAPTSPKAPNNMAEIIYGQLEQTISSSPEVATLTLKNDINAIIQFDLMEKKPKDSKPFSFLLNLKKDSSEPIIKKGSAKIANSSSADITVGIDSADFNKLLAGKLNGQTAFIQGKLKLNGNIMLAMKLEKVFKSLNQAKSIKSKL
ncbi:Hydroxysteroid dehydrogenase-like protein 2 [Smittium culicis]|uniref:Hydroxysteroid dehydrogenase-like protein 2 n=1 Tax=Smittium culicis TaxID=133412 RepID=A0A1R1YA15_9FUNG|nr:Hydroxysteroid dehydrogenase-like protein 2 [Smittium culicis]